MRDLSSIEQAHAGRPGGLQRTFYKNLNQASN